MKRLFIFLSLVMVASVHAAHSDEYENELQRALARRRAAQGEQPESERRTTSVPRRVVPRGRVNVPAGVAAVFGGGDAATPRRERPAPPRRPVVAPAGVQQLFASHASRHRAPVPARRVAPPVAAKPQTCTTCFDPVGKKDKIMLDCKHAFHKGCILPWVTGGYRGSQEHCQNCRAKLTAADKEKLGIASPRGVGEVASSGPRPIASGRVPVMGSRGQLLGDLTADEYAVLGDQGLRATARQWEWAGNTFGSSDRATPRVNAGFGPPYSSVLRPVYTRGDVQVRIGGVQGVIGDFGILNMDNKGLTDISGLQNLSAANKARVCTISLRNNSIRDLPTGILSGFPNLTEVDLTDNPLDGEVSPYVMSWGEAERLQRLRGLDLERLMQVRDMLDLPIERVPPHLHALHRRLFAKEILNRLIELTVG